MEADDYQNEKVRDYIRDKKKNLLKKIEQHNLTHLPVGGDDLKELEDDDLRANVVDNRVHKQIERMINQGSKTIKKGSDLY